MDAEARYARAQALASQPSEQAARELIAMLDDDEPVMIDEGFSVYDVEPTYAPVSSAARAALAQIAHAGWPVIVEALRGPAHASALLHALARLAPEQRAALPPAAFDVIVDKATGAERAEWAWERELAARAGELGAEAFWWARVDGHPSEHHREHALRRFAEITPDQGALVRELVAWLERPRAPFSVDAILAALRTLPLPATVVRALAGSDLVRRHPVLAGVLAPYGEPAAAIVPVCVDLLQHDKIGDYVPWTPQSPLDDRRWRLASEALIALGEHAAPARPVLVDRLLATNEQMSLQGSLRRRLVDALGDSGALLAALGPRIDALAASDDVVDRNRGQQLRDYLTARAQK